jgi:N-acetylmuramoyl-L-alanine amidase
MRYLRAFYFIFNRFICIAVFLACCSTEQCLAYQGVQGSFEASAEGSAHALRPLIIIDPGHGGSDEGAKVNAFIEKKLALTTALLTKRHLERLGYRVMMTRSRDAYVPLQRRTGIANKSKGSLFVSIHFNSSPKVEAHGIEIFYFDSKELWRTKASRRLANCILFRTVDQTGAISRGIKQGNFHVIRETDMPAVLVEGGFITNREERGRLRDKAYLDELATGIAQGIDEYMRM